MRALIEWGGPGYNGTEHDRARIITQPGGEAGPRRGVAEIQFQSGPVREVGVNGCQVEDLLEVARVRLMALQTPTYQDGLTQSAIVNIEHAIASLEERARQRERRGVEGTSAP